MNSEQIKKEVQKVIQEATKHRIGDFNDHEAHLLMKKEIVAALLRYLENYGTSDKTPA